jgi:hypothetical protein
VVEACSNLDCKRGLEEGVARWWRGSKNGSLDCCSTRGKIARMVT